MRLSVYRIYYETSEREMNDELACENVQIQLESKQIICLTTTRIEGEKKPLNSHVCNVLHWVKTQE